MKRYIKSQTLLTFVVTAVSALLFCKLNNQRRLGVQKFESDAASSSLELLFAEYYRDHGSYPPRISRRDPSEPYHSWRILLLPYMSPDWKIVYDKYDFSQAWDSHANLEALGKRVPKSYYIGKSNFETHYLAIDPDADWPFKGFKKSRIFKEADSQLLIIEDPDSGVHWAEPRY